MVLRVQQSIEYWAPQQAAAAGVLIGRSGPGETADDYYSGAASHYYSPLLVTAA